MQKQEPLVPGRPLFERLHPFFIFGRTNLDAANILPVDHLHDFVGVVEFDGLDVASAQVNVCLRPVDVAVEEQAEDLSEQIPLCLVSDLSKECVDVFDAAASVQPREFPRKAGRQRLQQAVAGFLPQHIDERLGMLLHHARTGNRVTTGARNSNEATLLVDADEFPFVRFQPSVGCVMVTDIQECADLVRLTGNQTPTVSEVVFHTVLDASFAVVSYRQSVERIIIFEAAEHDFDLQSSLLRLSARQEHIMKCLIEALRRKIRNAVGGAILYFFPVYGGNVHRDLPSTVGCN